MRVANSEVRKYVRDRVEFQNSPSKATGKPSMYGVRNWGVAYERS